MQAFEITLKGTSDILIHSSRLANPLDPIVKAMKKITSKKVNKTDDDHEELARLEFMGSLYMDDILGPIMPSDNIWRSMYDGAKKRRLGPKFQSAVIFTGGDNPLEYKGPRDIDGLWADKNFVHMASVKVAQSRVIRTRPVFKNWEVTAQGLLDTNILDMEDLKDIVEISGSMVGLGDWRPRHGQYTATITVK